MRLWSLHPRYLDAKGLVALWREGLLAQKVLHGRTRGYRHHPQLERFRMARNPLAAIASYLSAVADEAERRGYRFDRRRITHQRRSTRLTVADGQLRHELRHLRSKLKVRDPACLRQLVGLKLPDAHILFRVIEGPVASWERPSRAAQPKDRVSDPRYLPARPKRGSIHR
jgi:hypothetical protein